MDTQSWGGEISMDTTPPLFYATLKITSEGAD